MEASVEETKVVMPALLVIAGEDKVEVDVEVEGVEESGGTILRAASKVIIQLLLVTNRKNVTSMDNRM
jgi:hypothetical protein